MTNSNKEIENQIIEELEQPWDESTEKESAKLEKNIKKWNQIKETKENLWKLRRETFLEKKWPNWKYISYKLDAVNNYLKEISINITKIKDALFNDRKTIVTAIQIALYKAWYLPVWWIDWQRWPITRNAVDKFQRENWLWKQKNPWYLNVNTINKLIEISSKKDKESPEKGQTKSSKSQRKQINIPTPDNKIVEQPDKTRIAKKPTNIKNNKIDFKEITKDKQVDKEKKWWTIEEIRTDITRKIWYFKERHHWDKRFLFYNDNINSVNICGETYKYNEVNGLWFESIDWWWGFAIWTYSNWILEEWIKYYFDWVKEIWKFNYTGDLISWTIINADWSEESV